MEKIQKALEKARKQRQSAAEAAARDAGKHAGPPPASDATTAFGYEQTRVHKSLPAALEAQRVVTAESHADLVDTYRVLRTQVLHKLTAAGHNTLAITSATRGDGKSLTALNLAISIARRVTNTVLLVDLDLRQPSLHKYLGFATERGLSEYLLNGTSLPSCLVNPGFERLVILPAGAAVQGSSELLTTPKMLGLIDELKTRYRDRLILYDLPPLLVSDDALALLRHIDCCLLVVAEGRTRKGDVRRALELLEGIDLIGTVLNTSRDASGAVY